MNLGIILKLISLFKFLPKPVFSMVVSLLVILGSSGYFLINYVDAKHNQVTSAMESQNIAIQKEITSQYKLTSQSLENISNGITDMRAAVQKVNDKVWELSRDINRRK